MWQRLKKNYHSGGRKRIFARQLNPLLDSVDSGAIAGSADFVTPEGISRLVELRMQPGAH